MKTAWSWAHSRRACWSASVGSMYGPTRACRRTATTATPLRKVAASDAFSAFYTSVLGTAAVLDARAKDARRRQIEYDLAQAKAELNRVIEETLANDPHASDPQTFRSSRQARRNRALGNHLAQICIHPEKLRKKSHEALKRRKLATRILGDIPPVSRILGSRSPWECSLDEIERRMIAEEDDINVRSRECKNRAHINSSEIEARGLVKRLIAVARAMEKAESQTPIPSRDVKTAAKTDTQCATESIIEEIEVALQKGLPQYKFAVFEVEESCNCRALFDSITRELLSSNATTSPLEAIAKIAYNILVLPFPLSIHNYNILLLGFLRRGWHRLFRVVCQSIAQSYHIRTSQTIVCQLLHYRTLNDVVSFYDIIAHVAAALPRGTNVRRHRRAELDSPSIRLWAAYSDVVAHPIHVAERLARDTAVLEAIIAGMLHFGMLENAVHVLTNSLHQACPINVNLVQCILDECIATANFDAGIVILRLLVNNIVQIDATGLLKMKKLSEKIYVILHMLGLQLYCHHSPLELGAFGLQPSCYELFSLAMCVNELTRKLTRLERITSKLLEFSRATLGLAALEDRLVVFYTSRIGSQAGEWVEEEYDPLRFFGILVDEVDRASSMTYLLSREFQCLISTSLIESKKLHNLAFRHNPVGLPHVNDKSTRVSWLTQFKNVYGFKVRLLLPKVALLTNTA